MCHYCHISGHVRQNCRKLQNKNQRFQSIPYHKSLKFASTPIATLVESGETNTCFLSSSSTWVNDPGATDHMISNSSLFTTFQSHLATSTVNLTRTIHLTPLITLTSVMSLPQFSFNLIFLSKLTRTLNFSISYFFYYCLIQYLSTKWVICRGRVSRGFYILETEVPTLVACSRVVTPFELHFRLGHPALSLLKKLYP